MNYFYFFLLLVVIIIYYYLFYKVFNNRFEIVKEQVFYSEEHDTTKADRIKESDLLEGLENVEYSYTMWLYIDGIEYRKNQSKHILTKGTYSIENIYDTSPTIWISSDSKKIHISIYTDSGMELIEVSEIPIYKWFFLGVVVKEQTAEIYIDGRLERTYGLKGYLRTVPGDLWITQNEGFKGKMQNLRYFTISLKSRDILVMANSGRTTGLNFNFRGEQEEVETELQKTPERASVGSAIRKTSVCIIPPPMKNK